MKQSLFLILIFTFCFTISCSKQHVDKSINPDTSSVLYYGADSSGKIDASLAFRKALDSPNDMIVVPKGIYIINETIELKKHLRLMPGVLIKKTKIGNDGPIFWLSKSYSKLEGLNKKVEIKSEKNVPKGIIKIGHRNENVKKKNILFVEVTNLKLTGPGRSETEKNIGLYLFNAQAKHDGATTSYFHSISNLIIQHVDCGIMLEGMANANSINNIILNRVGQGPQDAAIHLKGSMENRIYDIFHHFSKGATTLLLENHFDQNKVRIRSSYNYIAQIVSEQGGDNAKCADIRSGYSNNIGILCNTNGGNVRYKNFEKDKNRMLFN